MYLDGNSDQLYELSEQVLAGASVTVSGSDGSSYLTTSAADGTYEVDGLTPGVTYTVSVAAAGQTLEGYYLPDGTPVPSASVNVVAGQTADLDAAFLAPPTTATTTTLGSSNLNPNVGGSVTFTATVSPSGGMGFPSGTVLFYNGADLIGASPLSAGG